MWFNFYYCGNVFFFSCQYLSYSVNDNEEESRNLFSFFVVKKNQTNFAIKMKNTIEIDIDESADNSSSRDFIRKSMNY